LRYLENIELFVKQEAKKCFININYPVIARITRPEFKTDNNLGFAE